jgi:hypothetical protein
MARWEASRPWYAWFYIFRESGAFIFLGREVLVRHTTTSNSSEFSAASYHLITITICLAPHLTSSHRSSRFLGPVGRPVRLNVGHMMLGPMINIVLLSSYVTTRIGSLTRASGLQISNFNTLVLAGNLGSAVQDGVKRMIGKKGACCGRRLNPRPNRMPRLCHLVFGFCICSWEVWTVVD